MFSIYNGQLVEGTVIDVKDDEIALNINYKALHMLVLQVIIK